MSGTLPPKRISSLELTAVLPRDSLAPVAIGTDLDELDEVVGPTAEQLRDCERAAQEGIPTLESCPACAGCDTCEGRHFVDCPTCGSHTRPCPGSCATCPVCLAMHMLESGEAAAWRRENLFQPEPSPEAA